MKPICFAFVAAIALFSGAAAADSAPGVALPADGDEYSALVARAAAHDATLDFRALRLAYLKSRAYQRAEPDMADALRKEMYEATRLPDGAATVRQKAEALLSIDYTNLEAHKLLRQSCALLHDDACAELHHFVEFGLLNSITHPGDGKSCATGWEAFQVREEYVVLRMFGMTVTQQSLITDGGHTCDAMDVKDENGAAHTYFFNIDVMWAAEAALFKK